MRLLEILASWVSGIGEWVLTLLERAPSFTAMYLLTIFGMHETVLEFLAGGWCESKTRAASSSCGGGLLFFSFMAFVALVVTVIADYSRLQYVDHSQH